MIKTFAFKFIDQEAWLFQFTVSFFSAIGAFFTQHVFGDAQFGIAMLLLISIDTILGAWKYWKLNEFELKSFFTGTMEKVILYALFVSAFWIVTQIKTNTGDNPLFWADWIGYSWIAGKEIVSIVRNADVVKPGWVPSWIIEKINTLDQTGKI